MNNKIIKIIMLTILVVMFVQVASADTIYGTGKRVYYDCLNATSGEPKGTTGVITCYDSAGNADVNAQAMTNVVAGIFYYSFSLVNDTYSCRIGCTCVGCLNYTVGLSVVPSPVDSDKYSTDIKTDVAAILVDTAAMDTAAEWDTLMANLLAKLEAATVNNATRLNRVMDTVSASVNTSKTSVESAVNTNATRVQKSVDQVSSDLNISRGHVIQNSRDINTTKSSIESAVSGNSTMLRLNENQISNDINTTKGYVDTEITELIGMSRGNATYWNVWGAATRTLTALGFAGVDLNVGSVNSTTVKGSGININSTGTTNFNLDKTGYTVSTVSDKTGYNLTENVIGVCQAIGTNGITAASIATSAIGADEIDANAITSSELATSAVEEIDTQLNLSHGTGNWSATGSTSSATISTADKQEIARLTLNYTTECTSLATRSLGCTVYSIEQYTR